MVFDTEILLLNLIDPKNSKDFQKDYNCKVCYNIRLNKETNYQKKKSDNKNSKAWQK